MKKIILTLMMSAAVMASYAQVTIALYRYQA